MKVTMRPRRSVGRVLRQIDRATAVLAARREALQAAQQQQQQRRGDADGCVRRQQADGTASPPDISRMTTASTFCRPMRSPSGPKTEAAERPHEERGGEDREGVQQRRGLGNMRSGIAAAVREVTWANTLAPLGTLRRAGLLAPMRPDRYVRMAAAVRREGMTATSGFAVTAQRCPDRPGLIDELGTLDLARDRRARQRARRRAAGHAGRRTRRRRHHGPQPPRLRRVTDRGQPNRRRRAAVEHVVRRTRAGRSGGSRGSRRRHLRRGVHRHRRPRADRTARRDRGSWPGPTIRPARPAPSRG